MHDSIPLGRIAGIRIGINWSWLIVFGLIAWSLASGVFPAENKGLSDTTYAVMGVVAARAAHVFRASRPEGRAARKQ